MSRKLTDQQKMFLEVLFDQAEGDFVTAKRLAGYSENYATSELVRGLKDEIIERTKEFIARSGPRAAVKVVGVMNNPIQLGAKEVLMASKEILDRAGVVKTEKVEVQSNGIFLIPAKKESDEYDD